MNNSQSRLLSSTDMGFKITLTSKIEKEISDCDYQQPQSARTVTHDHEKSQISERSSLLATDYIQKLKRKEKSKDKKRMKLADYIYIKNTSKKNQKLKTNKKSEKGNELRRSRIKEGRENAYFLIIKETEEEFRQISKRAQKLQNCVTEAFASESNTDDMTKLCRIRRIIKDQILGGLEEIESLMNVNQAESCNSPSNSPRLKQIDQMVESVEEEAIEDLDSRLMALEFLGVKRVESEKQPSSDFKKRISVNKKFSNKETEISEVMYESQEF